MRKQPSAVQVTVQLVGPILRQIIDDSPRPPREVALEHISLWMTATQLHLIRFTRSLVRESRLLASQGPTRVYAAQRVRVDEHMLLSSAANLQKALELFSAELPEIQLPPSLAELLHHMRNVYEHWEDYMPHVAKQPATNRSGKWMKEQQPDAKLWAIEIWPGEDVKLARVLSLRELHRQLRSLACQLRRAKSHS